MGRVVASARTATAAILGTTRGAGSVAYALARPGTYVGAGRELIAGAAHAIAYGVAIAETVVHRRDHARVDATAAVAPVVLVHGFGSTPAHWSVFRSTLRSVGFDCVTAVAYNPLTVDVVESSARLVGHIDAILAATGASKVHLVGHSLGGIIVRHAVEVGGAADRVATAVTICAPHGGTPWADPARVLPGWAVLRTVSQLRVGSSLLRRIEEAARANAESGRHAVRWVAFYANTDWVVPARRAQIRAGHDVTNVLLRDEGHLSPVVTDVIAAHVAGVLAAHETARHELSVA